jgi:hypothetical protein
VTQCSAGAKTFFGVPPIGNLGMYVWGCVLHGDEAHAVFQGPLRSVHGQRGMARPHSASDDTE